MADFTVGGIAFRSGRLSARDSLHCMRRLGPLLESFGDLMGSGALAGLAGKLIDTANAAEGEALPRGPSLGQLLEGVGPLVRALAKMPDADVDFVLDKCLSVTQRQQGAAWVNLWSPSAGRSMFDDLDANAELEIASHVLKEALSGFFAGLLRGSKGSPGATSTSSPPPFQTA